MLRVTRVAPKTESRSAVTHFFYLEHLSTGDKLCLNLLTFLVADLPTLKLFIALMVIGGIVFVIAEGVVLLDPSV